MWNPSIQQCALPLLLSKKSINFISETLSVCACVFMHFYVTYTLCIYVLHIKVELVHGPNDGAMKTYGLGT
jgi:hypothetical protein